MASSDGQDPSYVMKCRIGIDGRWQNIPGRLCELLGYSRNELMELPFSYIFRDDKKDTANNIETRILNNNLKEFEAELPATNKSGSVVWLYVSGAMIKDNSGNPQYVICYIHDITEGKTYQQKLEESEQKFRSLFQHNPDPVYYFDREGNFKGVNPKLVEFTGYSREKLLEMNYEDFITEKDLKRTKEYFARALSGTSGEYEIQVQIKDGQRKDIRVSKFPMYVGNKVTGVFGVFHDITQEKRANKQLSESEERWHRLLEKNPQPVQVTQDANIIFINEAGAKLYGAESPKQLIGKSVYEFCEPEKIEKIKTRKNRLENGKTVKDKFDHSIIRMDGESRYVEISSIPITYQGEPAVQTVIHDVTERKEKEQFIKDSLNEKETLLKEIHHRVKNNLAVISGLLELQAMNTSDDTTLNTLRDSQHRIHSIAIIHEKLYQSDALSEIGFEAYLKELVQSISQTYETAERKIDITYNLEPASLNIDQAIPCSLIVNEVIVNCFKHAFKSAKRGTINILTRFDRPNLTLEIHDNGCGLPENFDIHQQQSLGMTLIQTLAEQLDGKINFRSNGEGGTIFKLHFATSQ